MCFERLEHDDEVNTITTWDYRMHGLTRSEKTNQRKMKFQKHITKFMFASKDGDDVDEVDEVAERLSIVDLSADKTSLPKKQNVFVEKNKSSLSEEKPDIPPKAIRNHILSGLGLSQPEQQRSLSDEAKNLFNDAL